MLGVITSRLGSSPLARGTQLLISAVIDRCRLIPARAGNTGGRKSRAPGTAAHPRSRGEHIPRPAAVSTSGGSSPLARGTLVYGGTVGLVERLIPARAGNTGSWGLPASWRSAHPRSRGEHFGFRKYPLRWSGSSPLARGTLPATDAYINAWRLIPARAGNTRRINSSIRWHAAHPRSRGEHSKQTRQHPQQSGSSPLARGTPRPLLRRRPRLLLIPARAGNTEQLSRRTANRPAHPRSRGEHIKSVTDAIGSVGSSPLARGTQSVES
mgnify:CR=1 FL=1